MNAKLTELLKKIFCLTDAEFGETLTKDEVASWDSLKQMDLVTTLEKEFNIVLEMQDILDMQSIPAIVAVLQKKGVL